MTLNQEQTLVTSFCCLLKLQLQLLACLRAALLVSHSMEVGRQAASAGYPDQVQTPALQLAAGISDFHRGISELKDDVTDVTPKSFLLQGSKLSCSKYGASKLRGARCSKLPQGDPPASVFDSHLNDSVTTVSKVVRQLP